MEKPVTGKDRQKVWYLILALSFIWFLSLCIYFSGLKPDRDQVVSSRHNDENFEDTYESDSVKVPENPNDMIVKGKDKGTESVAEVNGMAKVNPIDNFFIGGDWDKYIDEILKEDNEKSETDGQKQIMMNEGRSISNGLGKGNEEKMDNISTNKVDDDNGVGDSISVKENMSKEVNRQTGMKDGEEIDSNTASDYESCSGRYIYIHDLPRQFNEDLLKHCRSLNEWYNMCPFISNFGLGPKIKNSDKVLSNTGWFETNQFMLEVIFHNRMKQYNCLTKNSSLASAIFVPYYAGLDVARYLWSSNRLTRDHYSLNLLKWLRERPEWKKMWGWDHFLVAGRITWDFRRLTDENSDWGNKLMLEPESRNMTMLTIESSPWHRNDFAIPYPTYFHPSSDDDVFQWQNKVRGMKRRFLFSFAGASRPNATDSIRTEIFKQCQAARRKCKLLECAPGSKKCYNPINLIKMFRSSIFCLQPPGDSLTRRSIFDSILAGCIPVFFHPGSAYVQYLWHLPKDYTEYSVFIPVNKVRHEKSIIGRTLSRIPKGKILAMRERVIKLIASVVYADPTSSLESLEDAFDITIDRVFQRIEKLRKDTKEGKNVSESEANGEEFTWKNSLFGTVGKHEWDPFFERT